MSSTTWTTFSCTARSSEQPRGHAAAFVPCGSHMNFCDTDVSGGLLGVDFSHWLLFVIGIRIPTGRVKIPHRTVYDMTLDLRRLSGRLSLSPSVSHFSACCQSFASSLGPGCGEVPMARAKEASRLTSSLISKAVGLLLPRSFAERGEGEQPCSGDPPTTWPG